MSEDNMDAAPDVSVVQASELAVPQNDQPIDILDASRALASMRRKREEPPAEAPTKAAEPEPESSKEVDAVPAEQATSEPTTETTEPTAESPIEPPRSWTKEDKEFFRTLPREAQEKVASREQERETHLRRSQNELAEQRKGIEAQRSQIEQARQQYETALPHLLQTLHQQQQGEFSDVKTMADVEKLAREDWPRYALWDAQQKKIAAVNQEVQAAKQRQTEEHQTKWSAFVAKEDADFIESIPELADKARQTKVAEAAIDTLQKIGYSKEELAQLWNNSDVFRSAKQQKLIYYAAKWFEAQEAVKKAVVKTVPPVQRPGSSAVKQSDDDIRAKTLEKQLDNSGSIKDAMALINARRASRK